MVGEDEKPNSASEPDMVAGEDSGEDSAGALGSDLSLPGRLGVEWLRRCEWWGLRLWCDDRGRCVLSRSNASSWAGSACAPGGSESVSDINHLLVRPIARVGKGARHDTSSLSGDFVTPRATSAWAEFAERPSSRLAAGVHQ